MDKNKTLNNDENFSLIDTKFTKFIIVSRECLGGENVYPRGPSTSNSGGNNDNN